MQFSELVSRDDWFLRLAAAGKFVDPYGKYEVFINETDISKERAII